MDLSMEISKENDSPPQLIADTNSAINDQTETTDSPPPPRLDPDASSEETE
ncbi:hypothetical protein NPIL_112321, partial [Nephila pilipes]